MSLSLTALAPEFVVFVPNTYAEPDAALTYWLSNPLLPAARVAATQERIGLMGLADQQATVLRIIKFIERERLSYRYDVHGYNLLRNLIRHELIETEERTSLKPHFLRLRGAEIDWEYSRMEQAIKAREAQAYPQADAA